ncbi:MAG: hypothetical protein AB7G13_16580 [Lautropia sp.]
MPAPAETAPETGTMSGSAAEAVPEAPAEAVPEAGAAPETTSEAAPQAVPETASQVAPETAPPAAPETSPQVVPETLSEAAPQPASETGPEHAVEPTSDVAPAVAAATGQRPNPPALPPAIAAQVRSIQGVLSFIERASVRLSAAASGIRFGNVMKQEQQVRAQLRVIGNQAIEPQADEAGLLSRLAELKTQADRIGSLLVRARPRQAPDAPQPTTPITPQQATAIRQGINRSMMALAAAPLHLRIEFDSAFSDPQPDTLLMGARMHAIHRGALGSLRQVRWIDVDRVQLAFGDGQEPAVVEAGFDQGGQLQLADAWRQNQGAKPQGTKPQGIKPRGPKPPDAKPVTAGHRPDGRRPADGRAGSQRGAGRDDPQRGSGQPAQPRAQGPGPAGEQRPEHGQKPGHGRREQQGRGQRRHGAPYGPPHGAPQGPHQGRPDTPGASDPRRLDGPRREHAAADGDRRDGREWKDGRPMRRDPARDAGDRKGPRDQRPPAPRAPLNTTMADKFRAAFAKAATDAGGDSGEPPASDDRKS